MTDIKIGTDYLPKVAREELCNFIDILEKEYEIENGSTALYWHLSHILSQILKDKNNV